MRTQLCGLLAHHERLGGEDAGAMGLRTLTQTLALTLTLALALTLPLPLPLGAMDQSDQAAAEEREVLRRFHEIFLQAPLLTMATLTTAILTY